MKAMVMGLSLLVYSLGQRAFRSALAISGQTVPNQLGKPTASPTLRWIFQCFMSVHLVSFGEVKQISNLKQVDKINFNNVSKLAREDIA